MCTTSNDVAWVCYFYGEPLGTTRDHSFVVADPPPGATYRIGVGTNWADDPDFGDIFVFSPSVSAPGDVAARPQLARPDSRARGGASRSRVHARTRHADELRRGRLPRESRCDAPGQELGAELYTSQPPVFYWLLRALAAPFGSSIPDIRVAFALLAIVGVAAAIALGWRLYGPPAGVAAGALVAIGPPYPSVAPTVSADVPAVALGLVSLALVTFALRSGAPRPWAGAAAPSSRWRC